jgi:diguanylate cyclase (GGDEF)-like protein
MGRCESGEAMAILIVDDSELIREQLKGYLESDGYAWIKGLASAGELFKAFEGPHNEDSEPQLVLLDWVLPDLSGIDTLKMLKNRPECRDVPVIMVTSKNDDADMESAMDAGASDFISKPVQKVALLARVRAALRLKTEMDRRKAREQELTEVTHRLEEVISSLQLISTMDALTGIPNRRLFDEALDREWRRCLRDESALSVVMVDLDHFKFYNDHYGHVSGDEALKLVAEALSAAIKRPGDMVARYGGEEFCAILPTTPAPGALVVAELMRQNVVRLGAEHARSPVAGHLTISCGAATMVPKRELRSSILVAAADEALYEAKRKGRNRTEINPLKE